MSAANRVPIYVFRDPHFAPAGDTVVSVAPIEAVVKIYGGGGTKETGGLSAVFGGVVVFGDDASSNLHIGVWGNRKAAKFRKAIRQAGMDVEVINTPPPGRLVWYGTRRAVTSPGKGVTAARRASLR